MICEETAESTLYWLTLRKRRYLMQFLEGHSPEMNWRYMHLIHVIERLEQALEDAIAGKYPRIIIIWPPRHGKTSLATHRFPAYCLHKRPFWKVIVGAHNEKKATDMTRKIRSICQLAKMDLSEDKSAAGEWELLQGGSCFAAGMQTGVAGTGANALIIDDPVRNRQDANSKTISDKILDEFTDSFMTRLEKVNLVIMSLTHWSQLDLAGRILEIDPDGWEVIKFPAIAEQNDVLGRAEGEALCPGLIPLKMLEYFRDKRPKTFESLYQGNPSAAGGDIVHREWFKYFKERPEKVYRTILSVDTAFKEKESNDYSVIGTWFETESAGYLDDVFREKMSFPKLRDALKSIAARVNPDLILIEDKGSGTSLIQDLQDQTLLPIVGVPADVSKTARLHRATGQYESGNIYHKQGAHWLNDFEHELLTFPNAVYDDQVDMVTHYINNIMKEVSDFIIV